MTPRLALGLVASLAALVIGAAWYMDSLPRRKRAAQPVEPREPERSDREASGEEYVPAAG
jgi:hypothetical protein